MVAIGLLSHAYHLHAQTDSIEIWKNEILETELNFSKMAKEAGISQAFLHYAAEDAVLKQNNTLFIGKKAIKTYYESQPTDKNISLAWKPDFVDVAKSGDLGYTYGYYQLSYVDPGGKTMDNKGVFHTVWKRQSDRTWRFVWD